MRLNITLESLAKAACGVLTAQNKAAVINKISIDTRTLERGDVYWVIKGLNHDGHNFIPAAIEKGASLIVAQTGHGGAAFAAGTALLEVEDTLKALQALAKYHRLKHDIKIAAVTGSNGKSTTKQMLMAIAAKAGKTCANIGNLNNHIGVPLSVLEITEDDVYGVFELGASKRGDIDEIASIVMPDVAVLTNVSPAHLEFFGDIETIFETKTEIIKSLNSTGTLVYNADDKMLNALKTSYTGKAISYGFNTGADLLIEDTKEGFSFDYKGARFSSPLNLERHNKLNAAAACGAAVALGLYKDTVERGLESFTPMPLRLQEETKGDTKFILDYYNANPASMENALDILVKNQGPLAAVLGDMAELGKYSKEYHEDLARKIIERGIKTVFLSGKEMENAFKVLSQEPSVMVKYSMDKNDLIPLIKEESKKGGTVLIKASRALNFEKIFEEI